MSITIGTVCSHWTVGSLLSFVGSSQRIYITRRTDSNPQLSYKKSIHPTSSSLLCSILHLALPAFLYRADGERLGEWTFCKMIGGCCLFNEWYIFFGSRIQDFRVFTFPHPFITLSANLYTVYSTVCNCILKCVNVFYPEICRFQDLRMFLLLLLFSQIIACLFIINKDSSSSHNIASIINSFSKCIIVNKSQTWSQKGQCHEINPAISSVEGFIGS